MKVLTIGTFDRLHPGHVELLDYGHFLAGSDGTLAVALNSRAFVKAYKGVDVDDYPNRMHALNDLAPAVRPGQIMLNPQEKPGDGGVSRLLLRFVPDVLLVGSDWGNSHVYLRQIGVTWADLAALGTILAYTPRQANGPSSTKQRTAEDSGTDPAFPPVLSNRQEFDAWKRQFYGALNDAAARSSRRAWYL